MPVRLPRLRVQNLAKVGLCDALSSRRAHVTTVRGCQGAIHHIAAVQHAQADSHLRALAHTFILNPIRPAGGATTPPTRPTASAPTCCCRCRGACGRRSDAGRRGRLRDGLQRPVAEGFAACMVGGRLDLCCFSFLLVCAC